MTWSMIQPNKQARRFPVLLSLFAVIAIYVVPLISQLNMQAHGMSHMDMNPTMHQHHNLPLSPTKQVIAQPPSSMEHMNEHGGREKMAESGSMDFHDPDHSAKSMDDSDTLGLRAACGFCTLLFHLACLAVLTFILPILVAISYPAISYTISTHLLPSRYSRLQPRAPPKTSHATFISSYSDLLA